MVVEKVVCQVVDIVGVQCFDQVEQDVVGYCFVEIVDVVEYGSCECFQVEYEIYLVMGDFIIGIDYYVSYCGQC